MDYKIDQFFGLNTAIRDKKTLKPGTSPDSLNWVTSKFRDSIELRRGYTRLGTTEVVGAGEVTGLGVGVGYDGVERLWFSHGRKVKYYDVATDDNVEVGTDLLPAAAASDQVWMRAYQALAGSFIYIGSANSSVYKIPVANPGSAVDQVVNNYRWGAFNIGQNRSFAGQRNGTVAGNNDETGLYLSYIDKDQLSDFTQVTGEVVGTGDGTEVTFTDTLSVVGAGKTLMYIAVTDGTESFIDDRNGNLEGSAGGTGTINYATGAISVTFAAAVTNLQNITASYYHETATATGILDFTGGLNGQGKSFRQDNGGGNLMAIFNISTTNYCFHRSKTWQFQSTLDDTQSTNLEYRSVGIPNSRAAHQTPDGIILADLANPNEPKYRKMKVLQGTDINTIEPMSFSDALDLSPYGHGKCVAYRWGDYEIFAVQKKTLGIVDAFNSVTFIFNTVSQTWDKLNYYVSCLVEYNGLLIAGDSISNNAYILFSGFDEDGDVIENYWTTSDLDLDTENLKTCRRMVIDGLIQTEQSIGIEISTNGGAFVNVFTIKGNADYVDSGIDVSIGAPTIGSTVVGGGGDSSASPYEVDFKLNTDRFTHIRVRAVALGVGYASINSIIFKDIRDKGRKNLPTRTR